MSVQKLLIIGTFLFSSFTFAEELVTDSPPAQEQAATEQAPATPPYKDLAAGVSPG